jgi:quinol monooxygenase YgiN
MELYIFARFHARDGHAAALAAALRAVLAPTRAEPGCIAINAFGSLRDPGLFYIHSRWIDEAAFDLHAELPHTRLFVERVEPLIDHPLEVTRTIMLDDAGPATRV